MNASLEDARTTLLREAAVAFGARNILLVAADDLLRLRSPQGARAEVAIDTDVDIEHCLVRIRVALPPRFPRTPPDIYLLEPGSRGFLPHVQLDTGWICYLSSEGNSISLRNPRAVVETAIALAARVLGDALSGRSRSDIADELAAYWQQFAHERPTPSFMVPGSFVKEIEYTVEADRVRYVADSMSQVRGFFPSASTGSVRRGVYVPLAVSARDDDLDPRTFTNKERLRDLLERHAPPNQRTLLRTKLERARPPQLVLLGVPRSDDSRAVVGIRCAQPRRGRRLLEDRSTPTRLIALERHDLPYLRARGGASPGVDAKHVALIGCGSVGGHVALALAFAGVGRLTLIDGEEMSVENTFRHCLGRAATGLKKTTALAAEIKRRLPEVRVDDHPVDAEVALDNGVVRPGGIDLVVVAIGNASESRHLNSLFRASRVPTVFAWLEPLGLGGHAVTSVPGTEGCYECLFAETDGSERLESRSDFAAAGQKFSRDVAGCATAFTPYADLDARRTAELATRLALDVLLGSETAGALVSWKGDAQAFTEAGFKVSERWQLTEDGLRAARHAFSSRGCPECARTGE